MPDTLGVIKLHTHFPRPLGDIGHPGSFSGPVLFDTVASATPASVVTPGQIAAAVQADLIAAAQRLVAQGATLITTSCGFVCAVHDVLAGAIEVPLVSSALNLVPALSAELAPGKRLGVLTFDGRVLSPRHFGRFWADTVVIEGIEQGRELYPVIQQDLSTLDPQRAEADVLEAAERLLQRHPDCAALLLECTNLPPYGAALRARFALPLFDIFSALQRVRADPAFALALSPESRHA
ncbi:aspartate/glutamate racemase family protein [Pseudomonas sp. nanlin1]|uniref:aspartate/glutamate racemase family protein n=1 Tax=Pseudomonas sp. nanlin1 TaxID=3040605 RepID=UPI00388EEA69